MTKLVVLNFLVFRLDYAFVGYKKMRMSKLYPWLKQTNRLSKMLCSNSIFSQKTCVNDHQRSCLRKFHGSRASLDAVKAERLKPTGIIDDGDEQFIIR